MEATGGQPPRQLRVCSRDLSGSLCYYGHVMQRCTFTGERRSQPAAYRQHRGLLLAGQGGTRRPLQSRGTATRFFTRRCGTRPACRPWSATQRCSRDHPCGTGSPQRYSSAPPSRSAGSLLRSSRARAPYRPRSPSGYRHLPPSCGTGSLTGYRDAQPPGRPWSHAVARTLGRAFPPHAGACNGFEPGVPRGSSGAGYRGERNLGKHRCVWAGRGRGTAGGCCPRGRAGSPGRPRRAHREPRGTASGDPGGSGWRTEGTAGAQAGGAGHPALLPPRIPVT